MADLVVEIGANTKALTSELKSAEVNLNKFASDASKTSAVLGGSMVRNSNQAAFALQNLGRVAQDAPFGFIGIQNNLNPLLESFGQLRKETGSNIGAIKALGSSLIGPAGLGLALSLVSSAVLFYQQYQQKANKTVDEAKKGSDEYIDTLNQVAQAQLKGAQSSATELTTLKLLYDQTQNVTLSQKQRLGAVNQLQDQYPGYFANIKDEAILAGKAGDKYNELTQAILASGRARAAVDLISKNQSRKLENEQKVIDLQKDQVKNEQNLAILKAREGSAQGSAGVGAAGGIGIARDIAIVEAKITENKEAQRNIATDIFKIDEKNLQLVKSVNAEVAKGAVLSGPIGDLPKTPKAKEVKNVRLPEFKRTGLEDVSGRVAIGLDGFLAQYRKTEAEIGKISLVPPIEPIVTGLGYINAELQTFNESASAIISDNIVSTFAGIGDAIGEALINGTSLAAGLGQSMLASLGSVLGQLGQLAIGTGIAIEGIKTAITNLQPVAAIAAGVALLALSGVVKGAAKKIGGGMGSGGSGGGGGSSIPTSSSIAAGSSVNNMNGGRVVFEIAGQKLIGVLANTQAANARYGP